MKNIQLEKLTKDELLKLAGKQKIEVKPRMLKNEIIAAIRKKMKTGIKTTRKKAKKKTKAAAGKSSARAGAKPARKSSVSTPKRRAPSPERSEKRAVSSSDLAPSFQLEDLSQEAKFIVAAPDVHGEFDSETSVDLPPGYGDHKLVMLVRDPRWVHLYWELQPQKIEQTLATVSLGIDQVRCILRIHPVGESKENPLDVDIDFRTGSHYINLSSPGRKFYSEIGFITPDGRFIALARSNTVTLPLDRPSEDIDERWMTTDEEFREFYELSGGPMRGGPASAEIPRLTLPGLDFDFSSGSVSSFSSPAGPSPWEEAPSLRLNAELVFSGKTEPENRVTLAGEVVSVRSDGTFTARLALPDGEYTFPITVEGPGGEIRDTLTPVITRKTRRIKKEN